MKRLFFLAFLLLSGLMASSALAQSTYTYAGPAINAVTNFSAPTNGSVRRNYVIGTQITGSFTTAAPLAANLTNQEIGPQVTSYSFDDGIAAIANTDALARKFKFKVTTNGAGQITQAEIEVARWQVAGANRTGGLTTSESRFDLIGVNPTDAIAVSNRDCIATGTTASGDTFCTSSNDTERRVANTAAGGAWTSPPLVVPVPTMSEWALILLGVLLAGGAALFVQRRQLAVRS